MHERPFGEQGGSKGDLGDLAGAGSTCGLNPETADLSGQHFIDDRFRLRNAKLARRQSERDVSSLDGRSLPTGRPAMWVGAPRTTRTEFQQLP
jgi:hypothetical protein